MLLPRRGEGMAPQHPANDGEVQIGQYPASGSGVHHGVRVVTQQHVRDLVQHDLVSVHGAGGLLVQDEIGIVGGHPDRVRAALTGRLGQGHQEQRPSPARGDVRAELANPAKAGKGEIAQPRRARRQKLVELVRVIPVRSAGRCAGAAMLTESG